MLSLLIFGGTSIAMILCVLLRLQLHIAKVTLDAYWLIAILGASIALVFGQISIESAFTGLTADTAINPIKILILFISMTILSIFLDEMGFFRYLANEVLRRSDTSQFRLFLYLYITVSLLTVFTSNDIIVLSFTPFICYFAKTAKINPLPYLLAEFIAANTWSMMLIVGNPTNIYLATSFGIDFISFAKVMLLPTICAGMIAFTILFLIFRKQLSKPFTPEAAAVNINDKFCLKVSLVHLAICIIVLAFGSYIGVEMWLVAFVSAISLYVWIGIISLVRRKPEEAMLISLKRAPWQLIPFVISMFIIILALNENNVTGAICSFFGENATIMKYGMTSFLSANLINNIPMSVLFCSVIESFTGQDRISAVYSAIIGSNIGAFLTPIGALAGIMWSSILKKNGVAFSSRDFIRVGVTVSVPTILTTLIVLSFVL